MPDINAYADTFTDLERLIGALNENGALVPGHDALKAELAATLEQVKVLKLQQESLKGNTLAATDRFLDKLDEGKVLARRLRSFIVSVLGPQSPFLPLFGIPPKPVANPNTRRRRKKKQEAPAQTPSNPPAAEATAKAAEPAKAADKE